MACLCAPIEHSEHAYTLLVRLLFLKCNIKLTNYMTDYHLAVYHCTAHIIVTEVVTVHYCNSSFCIIVLALLLAYFPLIALSLALRSWPWPWDNDLGGLDLALCVLGLGLVYLALTLAFSVGLANITGQYYRYWDKCPSSFRICRVCQGKDLGLTLNPNPT